MGVGYFPVDATDHLQILPAVDGGSETGRAGDVAKDGERMSAVFIELGYIPLEEGEDGPVEEFNVPAIGEGALLIPGVMMGEGDLPQQTARQEGEVKRIKEGTVSGSAKEGTSLPAHEEEVSPGRLLAVLEDINRLSALLLLGWNLDDELPHCWAGEDSLHYPFYEGLSFHVE